MDKIEIIKIEELKMEGQEFLDSVIDGFFVPHNDTCQQIFPTLLSWKAGKHYQIISAQYIDGSAYITCIDEQKEEHSMLYDEAVRYGVVFKQDISEPL